MFQETDKPMAMEQSIPLYITNRDYLRITSAVFRGGREEVYVDCMKFKRK